MAAEFVAEVLPSSVSASEAMRVDDATYLARIGLAEKPAETPPAEPAKEPEPEVKQVETPATEPEPETPAEPEPEPAKEPEPEPEPVKPPLTKFQVFEGEEEVDIPANLKFKFKANGKEYELAPDKTVLFAQQGIYNHEKQLQIEAAAREAEAKVQAAQIAEQKAQQLEQYYEKLFADPDFYERARELWARDNTPEAQAARYKAQLEQRDQQDYQNQELNYRGAFVKNVLTPKFEALLAENSTVNPNELIGQWTIMTTPLLRNGQIPVERLADVQALAENQLTHWARSVHTERSAEATKKATQVTAAKREVISAKRAVARVSSAAGAVGGDSTPQPKQFKSAKDWFQGTFGG